jgi:hypothetical protein
MTLNKHIFTYVSIQQSLHCSELGVGLINDPKTWGHLDDVLECEDAEEAKQEGALNENHHDVMI